MLGNLTKEQIELVLQSEVVGRIGSYSRNGMYIVPVTYTFHHGYIYAHSQEGRKISMMRENPKVCFQVDQMENMTNWRSVIVWGTYEELTNEEEQQAGMKILVDRLAPLMTSETLMPSHGHSHPPEVIEKPRKTVVYRIKVDNSSGRYEKSGFIHG